MLTFLQQVRCDIEEMSEKYCTEFDLKSEISKGDKGGESQPPKTKKKIRAGRKNHDTINTSKMRGNSNRFGESSSISSIEYIYIFGPPPFYSVS